MNSTTMKNVLSCIRRGQITGQASYVAVTQSCNMDCGFCTYHSRRRGVEEDPSEILSQIRNLSMVSESVVLTGGEPTISSNFFKYIRAAADFGFKEIIVESNGLMFSYPEFAQRFANSRATALRCTVMSHEPVIADTVTRVSGALNLTLRGLKELARFSQNQVISLRIPLLNENLETLDKSIAFFFEELPFLLQVELVLPDFSDSVVFMISIKKMERMLCRIPKGACAGGRVVVFAYNQFPAPCLFLDIDRVSDFFRLGPVDDVLSECFHKTEACRKCLIDSFCPGLHPYYGQGADLMNPEAIGPRDAGRMFVQWPHARAKSQDSDHPVCVFSEHQTQQENDCVDEALLRINFNCNERCLFCWIEPGLKPVRHEEILGHIREIQKRNVDTVVITGGEPTLHFRLTEYVKLIREAGPRHICLQTNATLLTDTDKAAALARAGVGLAMVSLHSHDPGVSDMLTGDIDPVRSWLSGPVGKFHDLHGYI